MFASRPSLVRSSCALGACLLLAASDAARADILTASNPAAIAIPDLGAASPYPSTINVAGLSGAITHVRLTLHNLSHTFDRDIDVLFVGPDGTNLVVMSDTGSGLPIEDATIILDDFAAEPLPNVGAVVSGMFKPTNYATLPIGPDVFDAPAPAPSAETELACFNGTNPIGLWQLFIMDDIIADSGAIAGGWSLTITTDSGTVACFASTPYAVGLAPSCVIMADVSGDGINDLVLANHALSLDNRISVLINNGDGTFAPSVFYTTDSLPYWIAVGDVDGDLDRDLAVSNSVGGSVSIFLNAGNGSFAPQVTYPIGAGPGPIALARLDADADLDIAVTNIIDDNISVLLNNGNGTFAAHSTYAVGDGPYGIAAVDVDVDGALDLAVANYGYGEPGSISILHNNGNGTFATQVIYPVDQGPVGLASDDLNGDGFGDLATVSQDVSRVSVLINNGSGTFAPVVTYPAPGAPYGIKIADFNADGFGDIAAAGEIGIVSILINQTDGTFGPTSNTDLDISMLGIDAGDVDGNGTLELAVACYGGSEVRVLFGEWPDITLQPGDLSIEEGQPATFTVIASGPGPFTYQWRRDGVDLEDVGTVSGSESDVLTIDPVALDDEGDYDVIVTNDCGPVISDIATLTVTPSCLGDIVPLPFGDQIVNVADLLTVITSWGPCGDCVTPGACPADIAPASPAKHDCVVNVADLLAVITHWGACP